MLNTVKVKFGESEVDMPLRAVLLCRTLRGEMRNDLNFLSTATVHSSLDISPEEMDIGKKFCIRHMDNALKQIPHPIPRNGLRGVVSDWDLHFVSNHDVDMLKAAYSKLGIDDLENLTNAYTSILISQNPDSLDTYLLKK